MGEIALENDGFNKNEKQLFFNQIKGLIMELNLSTDWGNIVLSVGHEKKRLVNFAIDKKDYPKVSGLFDVGDFVSLKFFLSSRKKDERWYTNANVLEISKWESF